MPEVTVRPLSAADVDAFRALRHAALVEEPTGFGASAEEEAAQSRDAVASRLSGLHGSRVWGAFTDAARLVGLAGFVAGPSAKTRHKGVLWGVYVAPEMRGSGVGARLVEAVITHAAGHVLVLQARVASDNAAATALYARLGFRLYGRERRGLFVAGRYYDEDLLALDLDGPAAAA